MQRTAPTSSGIRSRRPETRVYRDGPIVSWTEWTVPDVREALAAHVLGSFARSAQLADAAMGDDRVQSVVHTRVLGLLGLPFKVEPSATGDARRAKRVAGDLENLWWTLCPEPQVAELVRWAATMGFALAEIVWTMHHGQWLPTLRPWHPQLVSYRFDTRRYVVWTQDGLVEVTPGDGKWLLYAPHGEYRGWMAGAIRSVAVPWLLRQLAHRDWARYAEVHGSPIRACKVPDTASADDKEDYYRRIANLGTETTIQMPQSSDGTSFGLELIEASAGNWQAFEHLIGKCDVNIACAYLGQNLSTEVQGGSLAAAQAHLTVRQDYLEADAETLATTLHTQLLRPWAAFNYGDPDLAPWPRWDTTPPEDKARNATTLQSLSDAVGKLTSLGVPIDVQELAGRFDLPLRSTDSEGSLGLFDANVFQYGVVTINEARARMNLDPRPDGDRMATPPLPPLSSPTHLCDKTVELSQNLRKSGFVHGQLYADAVADRARSHASSILESDVEAVLAAVQGGESFDHVRRRLTDAYAQMDPEKLAELIFASQTMAHMAGRTAVDEDTR